MPRSKLRRDPCDCLDCREPAGPPPATAAGAVARQEPPPKSLILCISNALQSAGSLLDADLPHLDALVACGWAGLLACRSGGQPLPHQLLGLQRQAEPPPAGLLPDRFKQLRCVLLVDSPATAQAGTLAGCYDVQRLDSSGSGVLPPAPQLAQRIGRLLGVKPLVAAKAPPAAAGTIPALAAVLGAAGAAQGPHLPAVPQPQEGEEDEGDEVIDMLMLALDAAAVGPLPDAGETHPAAGGDDAADGAAAALQWADELLRSLNGVPGFRDTVLLSLVLGSGQRALLERPLPQEPPLIVPAAGAAAEAVGAAPDFPPVRRPLQSYQWAGLQRVAVDADRPAVVVHRLPGVIRVDGAARLELGQVLASGAAGCILAERLLPEVAYKLGRAAKYGA